MIQDVGIVVLTVILISVFYLLYRRDKKVFVKIESDIQETNRYLDTVFKRAQLSTSVEALKLLFEETQLSSDKFLYTQKERERYYEIRSFIVGKITGLLKINRILSN